MSYRIPQAADAPKRGPQPQAKKAFFPEYAGLRALAVLLVAVYHIWFNRVSGGVDVFLMLSAFFLTGTIARRLENGQRFKVLDYWKKVSLRIVPATVFLVLVVVVGSAFLLPGNRFEGILAQAKATVFFGQNFELAGEQVDYYATSSAMASPLQHFWSLSIQGQFYLLWPLLLLGIFFLGSYLLRLASARGWLTWLGIHETDGPAPWTRRVLAGGLAVVAAVSFSYALVAIGQDPQAAYFSSGARVWEFALGGLLALSLPWLSTKLAGHARVRVILGWLGAAALLSAGFLLANAHFPGAASLLPLGAAAAIMLSGDTGSKYGFDRLLRTGVLQFLAKHAYALYLWHWPILILMQRSGTPMTVAKGAAVLVVSIVLAVATTNWVINPLAQERQLRLPRRAPKTKTVKEAAAASTGPKWSLQLRPLLVPVSAIALTLGVVVGFTANVNATKEQAAAQTPTDNPGAESLKDGFVFEGSPAALTVPLSSQLDEQWAEQKQRCPEELGADDPALVNCYLYGEEDPAKATKTIVAVGDSHLEQWMTALDPIADEAGWQVIRLHRPACRFTLPGQRTYLDRDAQDQMGCDQFRQAASNYILNTEPDAVYALGSITWKPDPVSGEYEPETVVPGFEEAIQPFLDAGIDVVAQRDTPRSARNLAECVDVYSAGDPRCAIDPAEAMADTNPLEDLTPVRQTRGRIDTFEMTDMLCPSSKHVPDCPPVIGNVRVYLDQHHLTRDYVATTTDEFEKRFRSALD
ncbi:acyltransferase family protein [Micrococcoides hystricis]|uniref:Acyltransferase family protein n=1 Tax=Micrococcoides hystricis TaxID=1572761 RepID=A0ABV6P9Y5_9MICC